MRVAGNLAGETPACGFRLSLPVRQPPLAIISCMPPTVLVVDDDRPFRTLAARMLTRAGFAVAGEAENARRAIEAVLALAPAAVLLDVRLPDQDGFAVARELAALPSPPRIVLTSSDPDAATAEMVRRSGADAFVSKQELTDGLLRSLFAVA
jgi:CheY-like chemotaxis protein